MKNSHGLSFALTLMVLIAVIAPVHLCAQSGAGSISGAVRDPTGAVVPGATVIVTNTATNVAIIVASNEAGDFTPPHLPGGQYSVKVQREGFQPALVEQLRLDFRAEAFSALHRVRFGTGSVSRQS